MAENFQEDKDVINIRQFINDWAAALDESDMQKTNKACFEEMAAKNMDTDEGMVAELDQVCGYALLSLNSSILRIPYEINMIHVFCRFNGIVKMYIV